MKVTPEEAHLLGGHSGDVDRAAFLAEQLSGRLIHVHGPGWYAWNGQHWQTDEGAGARALIHEVSNDLLVLAMSDPHPAYMEAARTLRTTRYISNALGEMKAMEGVRRSVDELDADPYALNFQNGTVDLRSGEIRAHDSADLITSLVPYDFRADADTSRWVEYLKASQPGDPEMLVFLQRLAGYGLTGSTREECLAFFYGSGRNGKGVFTETLEHIFRPVCTTQNGDFWEKGKYGRKGSLVGKLHGARMVFSSEMSAARLDEEFVKGYAAADSLTADPKHKPAYDFTPTGLLIMSGNDKPTIRGTDDGIWARFRCVPWDESFIGREDRSLKEDLRGEHAEGVIAWCVAGAAEWHREGLNLPRRVSEATDDYREESNPYADWLDVNFAADAEGFVSNAEIKERGQSAHPRPPGTERAWKAAVVRYFSADGNAQKKVGGKVKKGARGVSLIPEKGAWPNGAIQNGYPEK